MKNLNNFCISPWLNIHVEADGRIRPCCMSTANDKSVNLKQNNLNQIMNSAMLKNIRSLLLKNEKPNSCQNCYMLESVGESTLRLASNERYKNLIEDRLAKTSEDGHVSDISLASIDIRFSNLCNFRCRTCWAEASTSWYSEVKFITSDKLNYNEVLKPAGTPEQMLSFLESIIPTLTEVNILGGEPFIEKDHYSFLEKLIEMRRFDIGLRYSTNLSHTSLGEKKIFDYLKMFKQVTVNVSCDGGGPQGELIRSGMNWNQMKINYRELQDSGIEYKMVTTVSILNVFHLIDFIKILLREKMLVSGNQLLLNILQQPPFYNIKILSKEERKILASKYQCFIQTELPTFKLKDSKIIIEQLNRVLTYADLGPGEWDMFEERRKFVIHTLKLDGLRKEKFLKLFPEFTELFFDIIPTIKE